MTQKTTLSFSDFYIAKLTTHPGAPYLLFIHGGPGYHCGVIEHLVLHEKLFDSLRYNIIVYDQRGCGRSHNEVDNISHATNVIDLENIYGFLKSSNIPLCGIMAHSYGSKLLFDFYQKTNVQIPGVFISCAKSILTPRINNLILDLAYLKRTNSALYKEKYDEMHDLNLSRLWSLTEALDPLFRQNDERPSLYWANLDYMEKVTHILQQLKIPINETVFSSVRKELYSREQNFSVDIESLSIPFLKINGFHDVITHGGDISFSQNASLTLFYQSSHYPHLEESELFCETVNAFLESIDIKSPEL